MRWLTGSSWRAYHIALRSSASPSSGRTCARSCCGDGRRSCRADRDADGCHWRGSPPVCRAPRAVCAGDRHRRPCRPVGARAWRYLRGAWRRRRCRPRCPASGRRRSACPGCWPQHGSCWSVRHVIEALPRSDRLRLVPPFDPAAERCALTWVLSMLSSSGMFPAAARRAKSLVHKPCAPSVVSVVDRGGRTIRGRAVLPAAA